MIRVSGVFRKMFTQAAPNPRSTGTGETRAPASMTPRTSAKAAPASVSFRIQRNPVTYTSTFAGSEKTSIVTFAERDGGAGRPAPPWGVADDQEQLVNLLASSSGAALPLLPSVSSQAFLYDPSATDALRMSLILLQPAVSSFFTP